MAEEKSEYEAMVVPRGARIISGEGGRIELDVNGDLILQESQQGLTSLTSHHGSILIDEGVMVRSSSIKANHMIRVRGRLETGEIKAARISLEGGTLRCAEVTTNSFISSDSDLEVRAIAADVVKISGGTVEIGSINSKTLHMEKHVRGAVLITSAEDRRLDETVQVKGGFESDIELFGYLLKYRREVMSDRVLRELKSRKEGREFQRFLLREREILEEDDSAEADIVVVEEQPQADAPDPEREAEALKEAMLEDERARAEELGEAELPTVEMTESVPDAVPRAVAERLNGFAEELKASLDDEENAPEVIKLVLNSLYEADLHGLHISYADWMEWLEDDRGRLSARTLEILDEIGDFVGSSEGE